MLANLTPAMASFRLLMERKPVDADFLISIIDGVLPPSTSRGGECGAVAGRATAPTGRPEGHQGDLPCRRGSGTEHVGAVICRGASRRR